MRVEYKETETGFTLTCGKAKAALVVMGDDVFTMTASGADRPKAWWRMACRFARIGAGLQDGEHYTEAAQTTDMPMAGHLQPFEVTKARGGVLLAITSPDDDTPAEIRVAVKGMMEVRVTAKGPPIDAYQLETLGAFLMSMCEFLTRAELFDAEALREYAERVLG